MHLECLDAVLCELTQYVAMRLVVCTLARRPVDMGACRQQKSFTDVGHLSSYLPS